MKVNIKQALFVIILAIVGIVFFFHKLDLVPPGFYVDEALHGYSAYSILETGKDEYGKAFPLVFRLYGSYNAPLYIYLTTIPIKIWDLNIFSVRFIAALSGLATVFVIYFFLKSMKFSTLGSLFFAITPWVVFQGRIGYEVSLAVFLFALGSLFLWQSTKKGKWIIPAFLVLSLSTYAAYAERFIVPALIILFILVFKNKVLAKENIRYSKYAVLVLLLTQIPHIILLTTPAFFPKAYEIGSGAIALQAEKLLGLFPRLLALALSFIREFLSQFTNYFSPSTLFLVNDSDLPQIPPFYQWMIVPYVLGLFVLWKKKPKDLSLFILLLALVTPIPSSLTKDPFSAHRAMPVVLPLTLVISVGIDKLVKLKLYKRHNLDMIIKSIFVVFVFVISVLFFWRSYFVFFPKEKAKYWGYGYNTLAETIKTNPYEHYLIDQARIQIPYVELAFFLKIPPEEFQRSVDPSIKIHYYEGLAFDPNFKFANVEMRVIQWEKDIYVNQVLVGDSLTISSKQAEEHFLEKVIEIKDPFGEVLFQGYKTNPAQKCQSEKVKSQFCTRSSTF